MMLSKTFGLWLALLLASGGAQAQQKWCATASPPPDRAGWFAQMSRETPHTAMVQSTLAIPIAFHVVTDGKKGKISSQQIAVLIENLNWAYRNTPFSFYLYKADTLKNKGFYNNCFFNTTNQQKLRKKLAVDTRYVVNVYSCKLGKPDWYGIATFPPGYPIPGNPGATYMQGIAVDPVVLGSTDFPYGLALAHEVGHYLGLFHTFETIFNSGQAGCADPGDFISDTPTQAFHTFGACPVGLDSCPALPGADDIPNLMNYATDECWDHFSPGQVAFMVKAVQDFRPTLGTR